MTTSLRSLILPVVLFISINMRAQQAVPSEIQPVDTVKAYSEIDTDLSYSKDMNRPVSSVKINLDNVKFTNELSVLEFLQGRVSGLDISNISTIAGESAQVILRGQNFNKNQSPLIVIDGIPQQSLKNLFNSVNNASEKIQELIPVSLEDIQSIEVLKDGSSTALYGADGANGVILIETKKGSRQKLSLSYQFNQSFVNTPSYLPMLNGEEYARYQTDAWYNANRFDPIPSEIAYDPDYQDYYNYSANTDWMNAVTQPGNAANHQLSYSGGNEKNRIYGSVNYRDEKGTTINTGTKRLLNRLNLEHYFSEKLTLALNLSYGTSKDDGNCMDVLGMAFLKAPNMSIWEYDAQGTKTGAYFTPYQDYQAYLNPVAVSEEGDALKTTKDLMTTAHLQYKVNDWLQLRETFSYNNLSKIAKVNIYYSSLGLDSLYGNQHINKISDTKYEQFRNEIQANVKVPFSNEQLNSLNSTFTWIRLDENYSTETNNSVDENINRLSGLNYERKKNAVVSSINYTLLDRYILMANARMESNSISDDRYIWDKFYGASLAWRFSQEPFFKKLKLNNGLIHAGWSFSEYIPDGGFSSFSFSSYNTSYNDPFNSINNNDLYFPANNIIHTPAYDAGLELGLFGNRLHISTDYYYKEPEIKSNSMISSSIWKMKNNGWEGAVDYAVINSKNLSWSLQFNIAHNEQTLVKAINGININSVIYENKGYGTYLAEGKPLGSIYGFQREGVYSSDEDAYARGRDGDIYYINGEPLPMMYRYFYTFKGGDTRYKDLNYDGRIDDADLVYLGNSNPTYTGGFGSTVRFKNITLTCNFHYRTGNKVINQTAMEAEGLYGKDNMSRSVLNRWRVQGEQEPGFMPRAYLDNPANYLPSDRYVEAGSFVRMNYLNLGYAFGPVFCQKIHLKDLSLNLSGQRLYTYSKYSGLNPEAKMSNNYMMGLNKDNSKVSAPEVYTISIRITI